MFRRRPFDEAWRFANAILASPSITIEPVTELKLSDVLTADGHFRHVALGFHLVPS